MRDERVRVALLVGMDDHAGRLVGQQDVLILIHDVQRRILDAAEGFFLARSIEILVVEV